MGLLGCIPAAVFAPCLAVDNTIAVLVPIHGAMGLHEIITDYVHGSATLPLMKILNVSLCVATVVCSFIDFNTRNNSRRIYYLFLLSDIVLTCR